MNEVPGARARVALSGLTMAEAFRDEGGKDVLFFMDNVFRFVQAGSEVSSLLGRVPSAVGYQPTLAEEMGLLQERITSTTEGSITSVQAIYVPADDFTDPAPATTFAHLDSTVTLSRALAITGYLSCHRSARVRLDRAPARHRRRRALSRGQRDQAVLQRYKDLQDIIAILGIEELSDEDKKLVFAREDPAFSFAAVRRSPRSLPAPKASMFRCEIPSARSARSSTASTTRSQKARSI